MSQTVEVAEEITGFLNRLCHVYFRGRYPLDKMMVGRPIVISDTIDRTRTIYSYPLTTINIHDSVPTHPKCTEKDPV